MAISKDRLQKIEAEAIKRLNLWLKYSTFDDMTVGGSFVRFDMSLGMLGYPFDKKWWMGNNFKSYITIKENESDEYKQIIYNLYKNELNGK